VRGRAEAALADFARAGAPSGRRVPRHASPEWLAGGGGGEGERSGVHPGGGGVAEEPDTATLWRYTPFGDVEGDYVPKKMDDCTGQEILNELLGHDGRLPPLRGRQAHPRAVPRHLAPASSGLLLVGGWPSPYSSRARLIHGQIRQPPAVTVTISTVARHGVHHLTVRPPAARGTGARESGPKVPGPGSPGGGTVDIVTGPPGTIRPITGDSAAPARAEDPHPVGLCGCAAAPGSAGRILASCRRARRPAGPASAEDRWIVYRMVEGSLV